MRSIGCLLHCGMGTRRYSLGVIPKCQKHLVAPYWQRQQQPRDFIHICALQNCFNFLINFCTKYKYSQVKIIIMQSAFGKYLLAHRHLVQTVAMPQGQTPFQLLFIFQHNARQALLASEAISMRRYILRILS